MSDELAGLSRLDHELDELVAGRDAGRRPRAEDEMAVLAAVAAGLREAVPEPSPEAARRGRVAFLAEVDRFPAMERRRRRRRLLLRASALAAALLLVGVPGALAGQALPGSPLWPVREVIQDARVALRSDPVAKARFLLGVAADLRDAAARASGSRRDELVAAGADRAREAMSRLRGVPGTAAAAERERAEDLLDDFEHLARDRRGDGGGGQRGPSPGSGSGGGRGSGGGGTGSGGGGTGHSGAGSGGSGSGSGSDSGSGSGGGGDSGSR